MKNFKINKEHLRETQIQDILNDFDSKTEATLVGLSANVGMPTCSDVY